MNDAVNAINPDFSFKSGEKKSRKSHPTTISQKLLGTSTRIKRPEVFNILALFNEHKCKIQDPECRFYVEVSVIHWSNFSINSPVKIPDTEGRFLRTITAFQHITASLFFRVAFLFLTHYPCSWDSGFLLLFSSSLHPYLQK